MTMPHEILMMSQPPTYLRMVAARPSHSSESSVECGLSDEKHSRPRAAVVITAPVLMLYCFTSGALAFRRPCSVYRSGVSQAERKGAHHTDFLLRVMLHLHEARSHFVKGSQGRIKGDVDVLGVRALSRHGEGEGHVLSGDAGHLAFSCTSFASVSGNVLSYREASKRISFHK